MRDSPLILNVPWGKGRAELISLWQIRENQSAHYPQKKKKPRRDGASEGMKE